MGKGTTRWMELIDDFVRSSHRELRITFKKTPQPEKWIFIVGCYNSGTTLLANVLGGHPKISALPEEGQYLTDQFPRDHEIGLSRMWVEREDLYRLTDQDEGPNVERLKREWGIRLDTSKVVFLEKTPANCARMLWLEKNFENAYFIGIVRDAVAVAEGIMRKARPIHRRDGWSLEMAAKQWERSNEIMFDDAKRVTRFHWLRYEDFTKDPGLELTKICEFLGLREKLSIEVDRVWSIHGRSGPIVNLNEESYKRLRNKDIDLVKTMCASLCKELGY